MLRRTLLFHQQPTNSLCPEAFLRTLTARGFTSYFGVPDSLLKELCKCITFHGEESKAAAKNKSCSPSAINIEHHIIAANEGNAIGLAAGYHLAKQQQQQDGGTSSPVFPVVYMQNSGLGNCVNPLTSLTHSEVYSLPMLLLIGWRGMPGAKKDEPQHVAMGRLTTNVLDACEVPHALLPREEGAALKAIEKAAAHMAEKKTPYALLVDRDTFAAPPASSVNSSSSSSHGLALELTREGAIEQLLKALPSTCPVVGNTGMISREVFETRKRLGQSNASDFLTVGAMGHASSIAAGIVLGQQSSSSSSSNDKKKKKVAQTLCIDGDGAFIMHMGSAAVLGGSCATKDHLIHIVLNNGAHDSVGGQPTVAFDVDLTAVAKASGYHVLCEKPVSTPDDLKKIVDNIAAICHMREQQHGPARPFSFNPMRKPMFVEIRVKKGNRKDLGRPTSSAAENRAAFVEFLKK